MLLGDCGAFQTQWVLGRVTATYPGQDGLVRTADVDVPHVTRPLPARALGRGNYATSLQVKKTTYRRPVVKLARLFLEEDEKIAGQDEPVQPPPQDV